MVLKMFKKWTKTFKWSKTFDAMFVKKKTKINKNDDDPPCTIHPSHQQIVTLNDTTKRGSIRKKC